MMRLFFGWINFGILILLGWYGYRRFMKKPIKDLIFKAEKVNLDLQCWTSDHFLLLFSFAMPGILICGIGFPLILGIILKKYIKMSESPYKVKEDNQFKSLAFFYKGFESKYGYWESLILVRKFLVCLIATLTDSIIEEVKWILIIIIF